MLPILNDVAFDLFTNCPRLALSDGKATLCPQLEYFRDQYRVLSPLMKSLDLSQNAMRYFSGQAIQMGERRLSRLKNPAERSLRLMAFIQDQFFLRQDYAADAFVKVLKSIINKAQAYEREQQYVAMKNLDETNRAIANHSKNTMGLIKLLNATLVDKTKTEHERNEIARNLINVFLEEQDPNLVDHHKNQDKVTQRHSNNIDYYELLFRHHISLQRSLGPLLRALSFDENRSDKKLIKAINYFKQGVKQLDDDTPKDFLAQKEITLLGGDHKIPAISRYKMLLFIHVSDALRRRTLLIEHSYKRRDLKTSWIPDSLWKEKRQSLLEQASMREFEDGEKVLEKYGSALTALFDKVNNEIRNNENTDFVQKTNGEWYIKDVEPDYSAAKYIPNLLAENKSKLLYEMIYEVDQYSGVLDKFTPVSSKHSKKDIDKQLLCATIMSIGTNLGHREMARTASDVNEKQLRDTEENWLSVYNLTKANREIVKTIQSLSLPSIYSSGDGTLHTSSDGKKVVVAVDSLLASYSYKYYGKEQGVSVNSFIDDKQSFFHVNVLTSSDREAPYMLDGMIETKDILFSDDALHRHSTDTHGYTEASFAALDFSNIAFAPRIKKVQKQTLYAYEAKTVKKKQTYAVKPSRAINKKKILKNWDNILRLMVSIKLGYCSAAETFKTLSSSDRETELYGAFKEYGRLIKTHFILNYIRDGELRRAINKQLNRVELGQKLSSKIFFAREGKIQVGTEPHITISQLSLTLLKNVLILWNYLFLSDYYYRASDLEEKERIVQGIEEGSIIAWDHANMQGVYFFSRVTRANFKASLRQMQQLDIKRSA